NTNFHGVALNWLETAKSQALIKKDSSDQTLGQVKLALMQVNRKLSKQPPPSTEEAPYELGLVPPKTEDPKRWLPQLTSGTLRPCVGVK
ncbi:Uncharacterized protein FKW44_001195, partial [Caligus rogercresseyi]